MASAETILAISFEGFVKRTRFLVKPENKGKKGIPFDFSPLKFSVNPRLPSSLGCDVNFSICFAAGNLETLTSSDHLFSKATATLSP